MKKCWRRSKQQISSQKWYKVRLWYLGLIFQLGFTWPVLYFTKLTLAMERTKCRAALTEASTAFWNTNPCHSSIQIHVSGSAQSMFLSLAKKKKKLLDLLPSTVVWPHSSNQILSCPLHARGKKLLCYQYILWFFIHATLQNSPVLFHQLQSPAQFDHFCEVVPALLTTHPSCTTSVP